MSEWHVPGWPTDIAVVLRSKDRKRTDPSYLQYQGSALPVVSEGNNHTPRLPFPRQSIPNVDWPSVTCRLLTSVRVSIGDNPLFSARARGIESRADANARIAYCSIDGICTLPLIHHRAKVHRDLNAPHRQLWPRR